MLQCKSDGFSASGCPVARRHRRQWRGRTR
ncbi:hypothetical protein NPIL_175081, partial [Nephila pilipes]